MRAFLVELMAMVDGTRVVAIASFVAGAVVLAALLAGNPAISIGDGGWIIAVGIVLSAAYQVAAGRRLAGRPNPGLWGFASGAGLAVGIAAFWGLSILLRPVVETDSRLAGNQVALAVVAWALLALGAVLWARGPLRRTTTFALAVSMGAILGGVAALREGGTWTPVAFLALLIGLGVFMAAAFPSYKARFGGRAGAASQPRTPPAPPRAPAPAPRAKAHTAADPQPVKRTSRRPRSR